MSVGAPREEEMLLMTPGPTRVPERVLRAGGRAMLHHRSAAFSRELAVLLELIRPVFGTRRPVLPVHTTGRGALEAVICNLCSAGDEIAVCCNGKFGEMWAGFAESYGVRVHRIAPEWGRDLVPGEIDAFLTEHPAVRAVAFAYVDTSTGVASDVPALANVIARHGALTMVDGIPSIGGMAFAFDAWALDVAVTASQKCLMASPGMAFVALSERAAARMAHAQLPRNYWNFADIERAIAKPKPETPGTTPVHLVLQLAEALRMIHEEGLEQVCARHTRVAGRVRAGLDDMGLAPQCPGAARYAATMTAVALEDPLTPAAVRGGLEARGILTAAGLDRYRASAFRIGHMGDIRLDDAERTLDALRVVVARVRSGEPSMAQ